MSAASVASSPQPVVRDGLAAAAAAAGCSDDSAAAAAAGRSDVNVNSPISA